MAATAIIRGNAAIRMRPDCPNWRVETQKTSVTLIYEGLYQDLLDSMPDIGQEITGFGNGLLVESVELVKAISGKATMTVILEVENDPPENPPTPVQPVYEIEWTQLERPIEQHPFFKSLFPDPTGKTEFSSDQVTALTNFRAWENDTAAGAAMTDYEKLTPGSDGNPGFQQLAQKKMRGESTYLLFAPVARITSLTRQVNTTVACGFLFDAPPGFPPEAIPSNYVWLSTADRSTRTGRRGKWQRVQEWTGSNSADTDLYPYASQ